MRKNILALLTFLFLFILTGCGSNSKPDGDAETSSEIVAVEMQNNYVIQDGSGVNFTLAIPITKKLDSSYLVTLNGYGLTVNGCTMSTTPNYSPATLTLDGGLNSVETLYVTGAFDQNCTVAGYTFTATQKVTKDSNADTRPFSATFDYSNPTGGGVVTSPTAKGYSFYNATTPLVISQANTNYDVKVQLLNDGFIIAGETVELMAFPADYGDVESYSVVTGADGYANFAYTSPKVFSANGPIQNPLEIVYKDENNNTYTQEIVLDFQSSIGGETQYSLINENDTTVNYPTQSAEIAVQVTKNGAPVAGESVTAKSIPASFGRIGNATVTTGADGYARFTYIAADTLIDGTQPLELVHTDENGVEATTVVNITILEKPLYAFINMSNITIEHGSQKEDIKVQLTYKGVPIAEKTVNMHAFSDENGTILNGYSIATDSVGYATFFYMGPETLDHVNVNDTFNLTIQFDEDATHLEGNATVKFDEKEEVIINPDTPTVVLPSSSNFHPLVLDSNSETVNIDVKVFKDNAPYTEGAVKVSLPDEAIKGVDVGIFANYNVSVNDQGIATFVYTGPSNLLQTLTSPEVDNNNSIFKFYHTENDVNESAALTVEYRVPADTHISRNYYLDVVTSGEFSMGIPDQEKTFSIELKAQDASGNDVALSDENITKTTVSTENALVAQIFDTVTGTSVNSLDLVPDSFVLKSKSLSGLVPLRVTMEFDDANGDPAVLNTIVNVRVYSGPASAISISYVSTTQDVDRAKYIEKLAISVTDEYGNKVNTKPNIALGAIVGYAVDGKEVSGTETNETKRLFYGKSDIENGIASGVIDPLGDDDNQTTEFTDTIPENVFKYVNAEGDNTDKLVVFGERKNYEAMGKWDITKIDDSTLSLQDDYYGIWREGLYYAVGHNYYQDQCREDGREWIGSTDSETYQLDEEGTVIVSYKYDYHLTGKDAMIWVNLDGIQPDTGAKTRVGEAVKHTLRGGGLVKVPTDGFSLKKGTNGYGTFVVWHENAPERYRNGHFGYAIKSGSTCAYRLVASSNHIYDDLGNDIADTDARTCDNGNSTDGTSYITFYLEADPADDCTFDITNILPSSEF